MDYNKKLFEELEKAGVLDDVGAVFFEEFMRAVLGDRCEELREYCQQTDADPRDVICESVGVFLDEHKEANE